jgi:plasmid maintenance system antidote protein VapI
MVKKRKTSSEDRSSRAKAASRAAAKDYGLREILKLGLLKGVPKSNIKFSPKRRAFTIQLGDRYAALDAKAAIDEALAKKGKMADLSVDTDGNLVVNKGISVDPFSPPKPLKVPASEEEKAERRAKREAKAKANAVLDYVGHSADKKDVRVLEAGQSWAVSTADKKEAVDLKRKLMDAYPVGMKVSVEHYKDKNGKLTGQYRVLVEKVERAEVAELPYTGLEGAKRRKALKKGLTEAQLGPIDIVDSGDRAPAVGEADSDIENDHDYSNGLPIADAEEILPNKKESLEQQQYNNLATAMGVSVKEARKVTADLRGLTQGDGGDRLARKVAEEIARERQFENLANIMGVSVEKAREVTAGLAKLTKDKAGMDSLLAGVTEELADVRTSKGKHAAAEEERRSGEKGKGDDGPAR